MNNTVFIVLLTWFLGNMGIHLLTPQLPLFTNTLGINGHYAQMCISLFLLGKSLGVLVWGPLAEIHGRRPYMLIGLILYGGAALLITLSNHITEILLLRFVQGLGVSATVLMGRTIINDCFPEKKAVKAFALLFTLAGVIIACLPMLGGILAQFSNWQSSFYVMSAYAFIVLIFSYYYLPETIPGSQQILSIKEILTDYGMVIKHPVFLSYLFISSLMVAGESAFNTSASFILIQQHSYSPLSYGTFKTILAIAHLLGSAVCAFAIRYTSTQLLIGLGVSSFLCASFMMLIFTAMHYSLFSALLVPMTIYYFGTGFIVATISAAIVRPFPQKMATAMAFCLFLQFLISSCFSFISSVLNIQTVAPLATVLMIISILSMVIWLTSVRPHSVIAAEKI